MQNIQRRVVVGVGFAAALAAMDQDLMRALLVSGSFFRTFADRRERSAPSDGNAADAVLEAAVRRMNPDIRVDIMRDRPVHDEEFFREYARRHAREHREAWEPVPGRRLLPVYQVAIRFDGDEKAGGERIWWESAVSPRAAAEAVAAEITPADFFHDGSAAANPAQRFDLVVSADVGDRATGPTRRVFEYEWGGFHSPPPPSATRASG